MITHLLDTSAILAHYFDEPGAAEVDALWQTPGNRMGLCVLSLPEMKTRLQEEVPDPEEVERVFRLYTDELTTTVPVSRAVAEEAIRIRESAPRRVPLVDSIVAACARTQSALLVHRDPHLASIPDTLVQQVRLPGRSG